LANTRAEKADRNNDPRRGLTFAAKMLYIVFQDLITTIICSWEDEVMRQVVEDDDGVGSGDGPAIEGDLSILISCSDSV
jgi:hypothetical protein